jgi:hypothetical protein
VSVKWWRRILLIAVAAAIVVVVYLYRQELGLVSSSRPTDQSSTSDAGSDQPVRPAHVVWQTVDRTADGFKIQMPADIREVQIPAYNEQGGAEQVDMILAYPDADTTYSLAWADNPPVERVNQGSVQQTLDMARNDALARTQTSLVNESRSSRMGFPTREFSGRNVGGGVFNARLILAGKRLYMLIAAYPSDSARRSQDVSHFFDSFSLASASKN